jgi:hypothetical protein
MNQTKNIFPSESVNFNFKHRTIKLNDHLLNENSDICVLFDQELKHMVLRINSFFSYDTPRYGAIRNYYLLGLNDHTNRNNFVYTVYERDYSDLLFSTVNTLNLMNQIENNLNEFELNVSCEGAREFKLNFVPITKETYEYIYAGMEVALVPIYCIGIMQNKGSFWMILNKNESGDDELLDFASYMKPIDWKNGREFGDDALNEDIFGEGVLNEEKLNEDMLNNNGLMESNDYDSTYEPLTGENPLDLIGDIQIMEDFHFKYTHDHLVNNLMKINNEINCLCRTLANNINSLSDYQNGHTIILQIHPVTHKLYKSYKERQVSLEMDKIKSHGFIFLNGTTIDILITDEKSSVVCECIYLKKIFNQMSGITKKPIDTNIIKEQNQINTASEFIQTNVTSSLNDDSDDDDDNFNYEIKLKTLNETLDKQ